MTITIQTDRPGARLNPAMWGIFFEDINFGADGGLYAELVKNRSFAFDDPLMGWSEVGSPGVMALREELPQNPVNPRFLRLIASAAGDGVANEGFRGMGVREGEGYAFSCYARRAKGSKPVRLRVVVVGSTGQTLGVGRVTALQPEWTRLNTIVRVSATDPKATLQILAEDAGTVDLDFLSLFPQNTWKKRRGGLRADLVQALADLKPGFVRFPGGCIVEGRTLATRYQWKTTIGPVEERKVLINRWNNEVRHRPAPDYFQSFGLGFYEYFLLCEDIGAQPLPILNCGMACQFNSSELAPLAELDPYIQDALDLIEFANGPATSPWGAKRAEMGHPKPFGMRLLGVGNEQWGPQYFERYLPFAEAVKKRYPEIQLVASAGPGPADRHFEYAWERFRTLSPDIVDEHCYDRPAWFLDNADRYDPYDRQGPKIFMGEYAAQSDRVVSPNNRNNGECALAEAAFLVGLERNGDVVHLAAYAPLLGHEAAWQWRPNLIWCDNLAVAPTPSYFVQQLFMHHRGDQLLPTTVHDAPTASNGKSRVYASATRDAKRKQTVVKLVNATAEPVSVALPGLSGTAEVFTLTLEPTAENPVGGPQAVAPHRTHVDLAALTLPAHTLLVLRATV